jgi:benzodiazapine receptor
VPREFKDWGGSIIAFLFVIAMNVMSNALPINNQSMAEISAKYPSLFTPAGFTFSIWGVIYLALLLFVVY